MMRKKPAYEGATKPLDKLYERMKDYMVDSNPQASEPSKVVSSEGATEVGFVSFNLQNQCPYFLVDTSCTE